MELLSVKDNRLLHEPLPPREVTYCFLDAHPDSNSNRIMRSFVQLKSQNYSGWAAVYFLQEPSEELLDFAQT
jgi:hypothetical protein